MRNAPSACICIPAVTPRFTADVSMMRWDDHLVLAAGHLLLRACAGVTQPRPDPRATLLKNLGVAPTDAMEMLGHSRVSVSLEICTDGMKTPAAEPWDGSARRQRQEADKKRGQRGGLPVGMCGVPLHA